MSENTAKIPEKSPEFGNFIDRIRDQRANLSRIVTSVTKIENKLFGEPPTTGKDEPDRPSLDGFYEELKQELNDSQYVLDDLGEIVQRITEKI